jgi:hypothetical protein
MLYYMLVGRFPHKGDTEEQIQKNIELGDIDFNSGLWLNLKVKGKEELDILIKGMLTITPQHRFSAQKALA